MALGPNPGQAKILRSGPDWHSLIRLILPGDASDELALAATAIAQQLAIEFVDTSNQSICADCFHLTYTSDAWQLYPPERSDGLGKHPLWVDFVQNPRFGQVLTTREPLAKAAGLRANQRPQIIDLTAGLGRDAWALASTGCSVMAFERHPLVHFLLADGLRRAQAYPNTEAIAQKISLHLGDARAYDGLFPGQEDPEKYPVWVMDPMFPERSKSALVKKDMRIFHHLVGQDDDAEELFAWARTRSGVRWIVKRPPQAPTISSDKPAMVITSGRVRFDCYLPTRKAIKT